MVSSKARVQRKIQASAPVHKKSASLSAHLSKDLAEKYGRRSIRVCKGDTVVVLRGDENARGIEGKVLEAFTGIGKVSIEGVTVNQADGSAVVRPVHASNLMVTKLNTEDQWRMDSLTKEESE